MEKLVLSVCGTLPQTSTPPCQCLSEKTAGMCGLSTQSGFPVWLRDETGFPIIAFPPADCILYDSITNDQNVVLIISMIPSFAGKVKSIVNNLLIRILKRRIPLPILLKNTRIGICELGQWGIRWQSEGLPHQNFSATAPHHFCFCINSILFLRQFRSALRLPDPEVWIHPHW